VVTMGIVLRAKEVPLGNSGRSNTSGPLLTRRTVWHRT
jgi:hypothetical protein